LAERIMTAPPILDTAFTIDGPTSRDLDDAIDVKRVDGVWQVRIYISDVAFKVPKGHKFDVGFEGEPDELVVEGVDSKPKHIRGARERIETRYYAAGNTPMLPRHLSEDKLSLLAGKKRHAMKIEVHLDDALDPVFLAKVSFEPFMSRKRLSYPDIPDILADSSSEAHADVKTAAQLAERLIERRREQGAFVLYDLNAGWVVDEDGFLKRLERDDSTFGYIIVQEMMILANQELARWCAANDVPVLYRTHQARAHAPDRGEILNDIRASMGQSYETIEQLRQRVHLVMQRAKYEPVLRGHYGLNVPCYMHATSPIRRYADLVNQRQIRAKLHGEPLPHTREELEAIANEINAFKDAQKEATREFLKNRDMTAAKRQAEVGRVMDRLSERDFDRVVKAITREGNGTVPEEFEKHFLSRLSAGSLSVQAMELALFEAPWPTWDAMRAAVLDHLKWNAHKAVSVAFVATQAGQMSEIKYRENRSGPDHQPIFIAKASRLDNECKTQYVRGRTAKAAQQRATVNLLALAAGLPVPEWEDGEVPKDAAPAKPEPPKSTAPVESDNPVSAIQEWIQALGPKAPTVEYLFGQEGPPHIPTFTCTCKVDKVEVTAKGSSKKDVKRAAAALAVKALRESV
jgi:ribonuclease R